MGWWKCNDNGGIDWNAPKHGTLVNAMKGDSPENYYNGDSPADAMCIPEAVIKSWFTDKEPKPNLDQIVQMLTEDKFDDNLFKHIPTSAIEKLKKSLWKEIDEIYKEAWNRPAYPEERILVCRFALGWAGGKSKRKDWKMDSRERQMVADYDAGKFPYWWRTA